MAVYRILVSGTVGYFTDFEKAREVLKSKPKSPFHTVSLIKADEIGYFNPIDSVNVSVSDHSLRKLTSEEIDGLSELYVTYTPTINSGMFELYLDDYSYLKNEFEIGDYNRWDSFFKHLGSIRKTYSLYMMFNYVVGDNYDDESFEEVIEYLDEESRYTYSDVKLNELIEQKDMNFIDYLSNQTDKKLRLAFDMAKIYLALMKD